jgi:hypothetical protein
MDKIDRKIVYNLLINNDILKYFNTDEKREFSSCCRFIYEKCSGVRLKNLIFGDEEFQAYINNTQKGLYWGHANYELKLDYFDNIFNIYKNRLQSLTYGGWDYFLIEYFSQKFTNLNSLFLEYIIVPKTTLKSVINNLPNLCSLSLSNIIVAYSKSDQFADFKFSKNLNGLKWGSCSQFELDSTDYLSMKQHKHTPKFENMNALDLSWDLVNTLKHLDWHSLAADDIQLFNRIIARNPGLISLTATLSSFNSESFDIISSNLNLKKLSVSLSGYPVTLNRSQLPKLPNIKTLEFYQIVGDNMRSIDLLVESCLNLKKLKLGYFADSDKYITRYFKILKNLKVLTIDSNDYKLSFLEYIIPESSLEQLIIKSNYPIKFNFKNFINLKSFRCINNVHKPYKIYHNKDEVPDYEELKGWRMIAHNISTHYWKII